MLVGSNPTPSMMFLYHFSELKFKFFYFGLSFICSFLIFFFFLPDLFLFSPFFFLHSKWDDAFYCFFIFSFILSSFWSLPLLLLFSFLWCLPALFPSERSLFILWSLFFFISFFIYFCCFPFLLWLSPSFFTSFHSDSFLFTPNILDFLSVFIDLSFGSLIICLFPFLIFAKVSRSFIYLFAILISSIFSDFFSFFFILFPLAFLIEFAFLFLFFISFW